MNNDPALLFVSFFYEVKNLLCYLVLFIEQKLPVIIKPIESKVFNTDGGPLVANMSSCTIDDMSDFVHENEFQILRTVLIA